MTESLGPHTVRASDAEREEFAYKIREAVGEGRLSLDEGDQRLAKVYAARFREDLPLLIRDLPPGSQGADRGAAGGGRAEAPGRGPGPWGRGRRGPGPQEWDAAGSPWGRQASDRAPWSGGPWDRGAWGPWVRGLGSRRRLALLRHAGLVAVVAAVLIGIWAITASHFFWPAFPLLFLTMGLIRHARWHSWARR
ncbi:MAG: hypothetical protein QOE61_3670 [Micromonosporaceae bacterium]|nr:hypothetical protein [Micromonosporaceae bacterium]